MSVKAIGWVFEHSRAKRTERLVLLSLADAANDEGVAWPSLTTIAKKAGIDRRTALRCVDALVELGELRRQSRGGQQGFGGRSNSYAVLMDQGQPDTTNQGQDDPRGGLSLVTPVPKVGAGVSKVGAGRPPNRKNRKNPIPCPADFVVTAQMRKWVEDKNLAVNVDEQTERFFEYHEARDNRFVSWPSAWRTWMRNANEWHPETKQGIGPDDGITYS